MSNALLRSVKNLEIEEKILNFGSLISVLGVFMPWFGGEWFGEPIVWSGFGFYTSFVGLVIFFAHVFILLLTLLPMLGYHIIRQSLRDTLRLIIGLECVLLVVVVWSILTNIAFDRAHMEIRFGIYLTFVGSIVVSLYSFLRLQQYRKKEVQELFHHPEDDASRIRKQRESAETESAPPPPPPPPPPSPEETRLFS